MQLADEGEHKRTHTTKEAICSALMWRIALTDRPTCTNTAHTGTQGPRRS